MNETEYNALLQQIPFFRFLGFHVVEASENGILAAMPFDDRHIGNPMIKAIHGGTVASFNEAIASLAVWEGHEERAPKPINLTVDYLRSARAKTLNVRASVTRRGRRFASVETLSWQEDAEKPVAKGLFHFLLV